MNSLPDYALHRIQHFLNRDVLNEIHLTIHKDEGNFSIFSHMKEYEQQALQNMYNVISNNNLWNFMKKDPPINTGYAFWSTPELSIISKGTEQDGHSGCSFSWALRNMQYIAKHGWTKYVEHISSSLF